MNFYLENRLDWPEKKIAFCNDFCSDNSIPKFILGRNIYSDSVANSISITGFIDDFTKDSSYMGLPILKTSDVPKSALVLNASGGRPHSAKARLDSAGLINLDYFAFYKITSISSLVPIRFNEGFQEEFLTNRIQYEWAYNLLKDTQSRTTFEKLVRFRFDYDISNLEGFTQREDVQYFEDFLKLGANDETFLDVGCFDGYTSLEFIRRCPHYHAIYAFEPDDANFKISSENLAAHPNVQIFSKGLSDKTATLNFDVSGSASRISETGAVSIDVVRLDDLNIHKPTLIKMDIEGGELAAIDGATNTIAKAHPKLAISAYHSAGDFWRIPQKILAIRNDYDVYMRHYTECIYETVLFFIPKESRG